MKPRHRPLAAALGLALAAWAAGGVLAPAWRLEAAAVPAVEPAPPRPLRAPAPAALPTVGVPGERLADLLAVALRHGVEVERVQQRLEAPPGLTRLAVGMSARGGYAELRAFLGAALAADPGLALDRVQLRRPGPDQDRLEAELQWSVYAGDAR